MAQYDGAMMVSEGHVKSERAQLVESRSSFQDDDMALMEKTAFARYLTQGGRGRMEVARQVQSVTSAVGDDESRITRAAIAIRRAGAAGLPSPRRKTVACREDC